MLLKAMNYNICSGRNFNASPDRTHATAPIDLSCVGKVLQKYSPDIVGLNEVRGEGSGEGYTAQAAALAAQTGMRFFFAPAIAFQGENPYGNALLSRYPILSAQTVLIPDPPVRDEDAYYETRCILKAVLDVDGRRLAVYVSHFGLANSEKRNAVAAVLELIQKEKRPALFMGDLNMTPEDTTLAPLFTAMRDTAAAGEGPMYSFPSHAPDCKLDYIFTSSHLRTHIAEVLPEQTSDHKPYFARLLWD